MGRWCFLLLLAIFCIGCTSEKAEEPLSWQITFFPLGAKVQFANRVPVKQISVFNPDGNIVAQLNFPTQPRQLESLYFEWRPGETYRFEATLPSEEVIVQTVTAPLEYARGNFEIAIPYGAAVKSDGRSALVEEQKALLLEGSKMNEWQRAN